MFYIRNILYVSLAKAITLFTKYAQAKACGYPKYYKLYVYQCFNCLWIYP